MAWPSNHSAGKVETADSNVGLSYPDSEIWPREGFLLKVDGICRTTLGENDCWPTHVDTHGHAYASICTHTHTHRNTHEHTGVDTHCHTYIYIHTERHLFLKGLNITSC